MSTSTASVATSAKAEVTAVAPVAVPAKPTMKDLKALLAKGNDDYRILYSGYELYPGEKSPESIAAAAARETAIQEEARRLAPVFRALTPRRQATLLEPNNCHNLAAEAGLVATLSSAEWRAFQDARVTLEEEKAAAEAAVWEAQADWAEWSARYD
jgi:hypothetical protein